MKSDYPTVLDTPCRIGACETSFGNENVRGESAVCGVGAVLRPAPTPHTALFLPVSFPKHVPAPGSGKGRSGHPQNGYYRKKTVR